MALDFRGQTVGDFVYHCHILEHEDGGMMSIIRVLPQGTSASAMFKSGAPASHLVPARAAVPLPGSKIPWCKQPPLSVSLASPPAQ
jgi:hypothetical protein